MQRRRQFLSTKNRARQIVLWELANRQWHNYMVFPVETQNRVAAFIQKMPEGVMSEEILDTLLGVVLHLGLQPVPE